MISREDILRVGHTQKPFSIRGEIIVIFHKAEYADIDTEYYFLEIEGIPVPFFVEEFTFVSNVSARVKFEDVDDEKTAMRYINLDVFLPREAVNAVHLQEGDEWESFVGYTIVDQHGKTLGIIRAVDSTTLNVLFIVQHKHKERELLIPATEDFIIATDAEKKILEMFLPEGLTNV